MQMLFLNIQIQEAKKTEGSEVIIFDRMALTKWD